MDIVNRTTFDGKTYVQLRGKDPSQWWEEGGPYNKTEYDTDEIQDVKKDLKRIRRERDAVQREMADDPDQKAALKEADDEYEAQAQYLRLIEHLRSAQPYGNPAWFGR